jgi:hypothetical protein
MPKRTLDEMTGIRIELQEVERKFLESLILQKQIGTASSAFETITKPFFGSGDQGILLTFIVATIIDDQVIPDDTILDFFLSPGTQELIKKSFWSVLAGAAAGATGISPDALVAVSRKWGDLTPDEKKQLKPILSAISRSAKTIKYYTGLYLGAKLGTDLLAATVPFA